MSQKFETKEFITRLKNREKSALEELTSFYNLALIKCCMGIGMDSENAKECAQNTWITFMDVVQNFEGRSQIKTFLFGILYNKAHETFRKYKRSQEFDSIDDVMENLFDKNGHWIKDQPSPDLFLSNKEFLKQLEDCLDNLPLSQKMAFSMREVQELDTAEICQALELTENNLNVIMYRAKNKLKTCLEEKSKEKTK